MATTLEVKLRTAAAANSALSALLGSSPFRWYGPQAQQGSVQPLVEVLRVSKTPLYSNTALIQTAKYRMQFTIWDTDLERARQVAAAIEQFLGTFNAFNSGDSKVLQPNQVLDTRIGQSQAQTDPITYWITMDVFIWNNETT